MRTRFCPRVLETAATTGSLIPLSENALLRASLVARGEKAVGKTQKEVRARTVTFFVFESPGDGELGPIVIINFYHNRSWHVFDRVLTLVPDDIPHCPH